MGDITSAQDGGGVTATYTYSPAGEVQSITSSLNDSTHPPNVVSNGRVSFTATATISIQSDCPGGSSELYSSWKYQQG